MSEITRRLSTYITDTGTDLKKMSEKTGIIIPDTCREIPGIEQAKSKRPLCFPRRQPQRLMRGFDCLGTRRILRREAQVIQCQAGLPGKQSGEHPQLFRVWCLRGSLELPGGRFVPVFVLVDPQQARHARPPLVHLLSILTHTNMAKNFSDSSLSLNIFRWTSYLPVIL